MKDIRLGSHKSRPMEKATLDAAMTVAFNADVVESRPPNTITATPIAGMKPSAARTMAVSLNFPNTCQAVESLGSMAPRETNRINR